MSCTDILPKLKCPCIVGQLFLFIYIYVINRSNVPFFKKIMTGKKEEIILSEFRLLYFSVYVYYRYDQVKVQTLSSNFFFSL